MSFRSAILVVTFFVVVYAPASIFACDGFVFEEIYLRGKPENELILTEHKPPILTEKCTLKMHGCVEIAHDVSGPIELDWNITKDGNQQLIGHEDNFCESMQRMSDEDKALIQSMGIPLECPISKGKICKKDEEISMAQHKANLPMMEGGATGWVKIKTTTGLSTFEFSNKLTKTATA